MKKITLITWCLGLMMVASAFAVSTASGDDVRGTYWNAEKTAKIRIYRAKNDKYYGKIEMLVEPNNAEGTPKKDPQNPDKNLQSRDRLGMIVMKSFEWNADDNEWQDGTIYDPNNGKTYDGYMYFEGGNTKILKLRGYVMGMTWLGRTSDWERIE
jgi:uncharacterized protein (DUF2147 family)